MELLSQFEAQLSIVPRWSIVHTIQKQSVAEHSYRVGLMVPRILAWIWNEECEIDIQRAALLHDQDEAFTGDIPSPAKPHMEYSKYSIIQHYRPFMKEQDWELANHQIVAIKIADLVEGMYFMQWEKLLGNRSIEWIQQDMTAKLHDLMGKFSLSKEYYEILNWIASLNQQDPLDENSPRTKAPF